jgi:hypothetical protein
MFVGDGVEDGGGSARSAKRGTRREGGQVNPKLKQSK